MLHQHLNVALATDALKRGVGCGFGPFRFGECSSHTPLLLLSALPPSSYSFMATLWKEQLPQHAATVYQCYCYMLNVFRKNNFPPAIDLLSNSNWSPVHLTSMFLVFLRIFFFTSELKVEKDISIECAWK